jgi:hypothetical protein
MWGNPEGSARNRKLSATKEIAGKKVERKNYEKITQNGVFTSICMYRMEMMIEEEKGGVFVVGIKIILLCTKTLLCWFVSYVAVRVHKIGGGKCTS